MQFNGLFNRLLILVNVIVLDLSTEMFVCILRGLVVRLLS